MRSSREARPPAVIVGVTVGVVTIGGFGYLLAVNHAARWAVVLAALAAGLAVWSENRHAADTRRQVAKLDTVPRPRAAAEDSQRFLTGS